MKKLVFLSLLFLVSCKEYRAMMAEETKNIKNEKVYFTDKQFETVDVSINNATHRMFFDTGSGVTMLYKPKFPLSPKKKVREKSVYGFDKKTKISSFNYSADYMATNMFFVKDKYLYVTEATKNQCDSVPTFDGILGNLSDSDLILELNYEKGYLQFVDSIETSGLVALNAKYNDFTGKVSVELEVNGIKDYFLFDTGNKTMTMLNKEVFKFETPKFYSIDFLSKAVGNKLVSVRLDIYSARVTLGDMAFDYPVAVDKTSQRSILNKNFVQKFNWFFDKKNQKAYCKPIDLKRLVADSDNSRQPKRLLSVVSNDKLLVSYRNFDSSFHVGDEIISIDGVNVTPENNCKFSALLNETEDWNRLSIKAER